MFNLRDVGQWFSDPNVQTFMFVVFVSLEQEKSFPRMHSVKTREIRDTITYMNLLLYYLQGYLAFISASYLYIFIGRIC